MDLRMIRKILRKVWWAFAVLGGIVFGIVMKRVLPSSSSEGRIPHRPQRPPFKIPEPYTPSTDKNKLEQLRKKLENQ